VVGRLRELADQLVGAQPSFETQRRIWAGHHAIVELADNELVGHFYRDLLDTAEALIVDVVFPSEGIEGDRERQRIATHASMFAAVADGNVEAARHHAELVRLVSLPLREPTG
jgi:DNA-binding GntR family transcriptional regulator